MVLIIDNYDSFTYNIGQLVGRVKPDIRVVLRDQVTIGMIKENKPSHLIISSGSGGPKDIGDYSKFINLLKGDIPILGIDLGHQIICKNFGARISNIKKPAHGKRDEIHIANGSRIFKGLAPIIGAAMYHSSIVEKMTLPDELLVIAEDGEGQVMGIKHRDYEIYGLQFHPESIMTAEGGTIIENFLNIGGGIL